MKTRLRLLVFLFACLAALLFLAACQGSADYDIRGTWDYIMIAADGNIYDAGTMTFSGSPARGTYVEINIYAVEYEGEYKVDRTSLTLAGDETWEGTLTDADHMGGTWQHDDGFRGTWTAVRRAP